MQAPIEPAGVAASAKRQRRMTQILDALDARGEATLLELSDALSVSAATVRRDVSDLADQGLLLRTHGGARVIQTHNELPMSLRDTRFQEAKRTIAAVAAEMVPKQRLAVALSGGSTTAHVARALVDHTNLTIVTNSLSIAQLVTAYPRLKVMMTGGMLRSESLEIVGVLAEKTFKAVNVGIAILGTDGISAAGGVTTHDETEARTNNAMIVNAQRSIVVADGSKVGRLTLAQVAPIEEIDTLVTDVSADPDALEAIRAAGVHVVVAQSN
ncbi:MAG: DeoR/GlpR family DNA-binding transcription regulator [Microbacterium sp.]